MRGSYEISDKNVTNRTVGCGRKKERRCNRPYSLYPPSFHALKDWWDKSDVTWFLRGQTGDKISRSSCRSSLFILDNIKWTTFSIKDDNSKLWVEVIIFSFLDAAATLDLLKQATMTLIFSKLKLTFCMTINYKWSLRFESKQTKSSATFRIGKFSFLFAPEIPRDIAFIPPILKRVQRWRISRIRSIVAPFPFPTTAPFSQITHSYFRLPFIFASFLLSESLEQMVWKQ